MAGCLTDAWGGFGGLVGHLSRLANVLDLSIADPPGIAVTYDRRIHALIQKAALKRSPITDYFGILGNANADVKGAAIRDFETRAETAKIEKGKRVADNEREKAKRIKDNWNGKGFGKKSDEAEKAAEATPAMKKWTKEERTTWNKKKAEATAEAKPKAKAETDTRKVAQEPK